MKLLKKRSFWKNKWNGGKKIKLLKTCEIFEKINEMVNEIFEKNWVFEKQNSGFETEMNFLKKNEIFQKKMKFFKKKMKFLLWLHLVLYLLCDNDNSE